MAHSSPMEVRTITSKKRLGFLSKDNCEVLLTGVLLLLSEELGDLLANLVVGQRNIILGVTVVGHEGEETVVGDVELIDMLVTFPEELTR